MATIENSTKILDFTAFKQQRAHAYEQEHSDYAQMLKSFAPASPMPGFVWQPMWVLVPEGSAPQPE